MKGEGIFFRKAGVYGSKGLITFVSESDVPMGVQVTHGYWRRYTRTSTSDDRQTVVMSSSNYHLSNT